MDLEARPKADSSALATVQGECSKFAGSHSGSLGLILTLRMNHIGFASLWRRKLDLGVAGRMTLFETSFFP